MVSLISREEGAFLALFGHTPSDIVATKVLFGLDVLLHRLGLHPIFFYWVV